MYSPVWRVMIRVDWYARRAGETEREKLDVPMLSPEYRDRRSVLDAWLWDFKLARIYDNYFANPTHPRFRGAINKYVEYHRPRLDEQLGWEIEAIRIHALSGVMPPPAELGDWTPETAPLDDTFYDKTFPSPK